MHRADAMAVLAEVRDGNPVITGPGGASGALWSRGHVPPTIYNMEMGYAAPMCLGVALACPDERVVAVEGDGSILAGSPALFTIGTLAPPNLVILAVDNGVYETIGRGQTRTAAGEGVSLADLAVASGLPADRVVVVGETEELRAALERALEEPGPWVVVARVDPVVGRQRSTSRPIPELDVVESAIEFRRHLAERERSVTELPTDEESPPGGSAHVT